MMEQPGEEKGDGVPAPVKRGRPVRIKRTSDLVEAPKPKAPKKSLKKPSLPRKKQKQVWIWV